MFERAEAGDALLQIPSIALAETLYIVAHTDGVEGRVVNNDPADAREKLVTTGPLTVVEFGYADVPAFVDELESFTLHDAMVVASHRTRDTDAVLTSDGVLRDAGVPTIWE